MTNTKGNMHRHDKKAVCHESVFNDNDVRVTEELLMPWFK